MMSTFCKGGVGIFSPYGRLRKTPDIGVTLHPSSMRSPFSVRLVPRDSQALISGVLRSRRKYDFLLHPQSIDLKAIKSPTTRLAGGLMKPPSRRGLKPKSMNAEHRTSNIELRIRHSIVFNTIKPCFTTTPTIGNFFSQWTERSDFLLMIQYWTFNVRCSKNYCRSNVSPDRSEPLRVARAFARGLIYCN